MDLPQAFVKTNRALLSAFTASYIKDAGGCWLWQGPTNGVYGQMVFYRPFKRIGAHRVSFMLFRGEILCGMSVCHTCDVPMCVNPKHLWLGTQRDNLRDMMRKGRRVQPNVRGVRNGRAILTEAKVRKILRSTQSSIQLAKIYGVEPVTINAIRYRRIWKWLHV